MNILSMQQAYPNAFYITFLTAFGYEPKITRNDIRQRNYSSFLYIRRGSYVYEYDGGSFTAPAGSVLYIPTHSCHRYRVLSPSAFTVQVDFLTTGIADGQPLAFSKFPLLLPGPLAQEHDLLFSGLVENGNTADAAAQCRVLSDLYSLFAAFAQQRQLPVRSHDKRRKIAPAIAYIERHYNERLYVETLAKLCSLSPSQLRRLFHEVTQQSPLEYKNALCIRLAKEMLQTSALPITDIASSLGYENLYYFSNAFKRATGLSPRAYRSQAEESF